MEYTALWGPKGFIVSPEKIVPLNDLTTSIALKQDNGTDTSGTSPTNTKGIEPQTISLSTTYVKSAGVDPRSQIEEWKAQVGNAYPLYIGGVRFGPNKLKLTKVDVTNILLSPKGVFLSTKVAVTLEEYDEPNSVTAPTVPTAPIVPTDPTANRMSDVNKKKMAEYKFATIIAPKEPPSIPTSSGTADTAGVTAGVSTGASTTGGFSVGVGVGLGGSGGGYKIYNPELTGGY